MPVASFKKQYSIKHLRGDIDYDIEPLDTVEVQRPALITKRWSPLRHYDVQQAFLRSTTRFNIAPPGRRSGKTEIAKRRLVRKALSYTGETETRFIASAPTHSQAKRIYWRDLKLLVPKTLRSRPSESELTISLVNGAVIVVMGMDVPERVEGSPISHWLGDEYGNMKPQVWPEHVRPALSDTLGTADFIGVPEGRNHYYDLAQAAQEGDPEWAYFHWFSSLILPASEVAAARRVLDEKTFRQEYEGAFITFSGLAYYPYDDSLHTKHWKYQPDLPLITCWDFNVAPGTMSLVQESGTETFVFGEIYIEDDSNTPRICSKFLSVYSEHKGDVLCYGDPSGGARHTSQTEGSDWVLIRDRLKRVFGSRLKMRVDDGPPTQRARINAVNSRLLAADGSVHLYIDPSCKYTHKDFAGVGVKEGGNEIDKSDAKLTHLTDVIGYFIAKKYPVVRRFTSSEQY